MPYKVPLVGKVTFVAPVEVKVIEFAPEVANVEPFASVNVPVVVLIVAPFTLVGVIAPKVNVIAGVVVAVATEPLTPFAVTTETEVTVPPPEALKTPPLKLKPEPIVNSSTLPVPAVERPKSLAVAICWNLLNVTAFVEIVVVIGLAPEPVTSPVKVMLPPPVPPKVGSV